MMSKIIWGALGLSILLAFTPLAFFSLAILLYILAYTTSRSGRRVRQVIWNYLILFSSCIVIYQVGWILKIRISPVVVLVLLALMTALIIVRFPHPKRPKSPAPGSEILGIVAGITICLYVSLPIILSPSYANILRYSAKTGDDINHIAMIEADRKTETLVYSHSPTNSRLLDPYFVAYPQGWHINGALFESLFVKLVGADSLGPRLLSYYLYKLLWLFIATYMSFELLATLLKTFYRQSPNFYLVAVVSATLSAFLLVSLFGYGFQNFIAAIGLVLAAILLTCRWLRTDDSANKRLYIMGLALMSVASVATWVLPGAIVSLLTSGVVIKTLSSDRRHITPPIWAILFIATALVLSQLYVVETGAHGKASSLNSGGATPPISALGVMVLLGVTLAVLVKQNSVRKKWLIAITILASFEFILLAAYQQLSLGSIHYYAIKLAFLTAFVSSIIFYSSVIDMLQRWRRTTWLKSVAFILPIIVLPLVLGLDLRKSAYSLKDSAPITQSTATYMLNLKNSDPNEIISTHDKGQTYLATKLWSSIRPFSSPQRQKLLDDLDYAISH